ncbi:MAG: hypothetical protein M1120_03495 [Patescibacteria group bacterium]|nr:hypothetical protein [Patescibacteria group bacterium]
MLPEFNQEIGQLRQILNTAPNILLLLKKDPSYDETAASLGLFLALINNNKKAVLCSPGDLTVAYSDLVGINQIKKEIGGKNFVISLDYQEGAIEKVSYNIDNNKFNLVIIPRQGSSWEISPDKVQFLHQAGDFGLIIALNISGKEELNTIYPNEQSLFTKIPIFTISNLINNNITENGIIMPQAASLSEIIVRILQELSLNFDNDAAGNFLKGIYQATDNLLGDKLSPETFEAVAACLRYGGQIPVKKTADFDKNAGETLSHLAHPKINVSQADGDGNGGNKPPEDWLKPKIFKGSTLL